MRVLISGATGFIGRALTQRLVSDGHEVVSLGRSRERALRDLPGIHDAVEWSAGNSLDPAVLDGCDAVVHLAGENVQGRWTRAKHETVRESRMTTTRGLVDAIGAAARPPAVLVSASGIGMYGDGGEAVVDENASPGSDYFASLCQDWEEEANRAEKAGVRVACARFGIILGPGGGALQAMHLPFFLGIGGPLGSGRQWWAWMALEDAVRAILFAIETDSVRGPLNMVAPEPVRQRDFARGLARVLHRPAFAPAPGFALRIILGTFAVEVLSSKRVVPAKLLEHGFRHDVPGLEDALSGALGHRSPPSLLLPVVASATLGLAPFFPEPHVVGKLRWLGGGAKGMELVDWLDLVMHSSPWLWLVWALVARFAVPRR